MREASSEYWGNLQEPTPDNELAVSIYDDGARDAINESGGINWTAVFDFARQIYFVEVDSDMLWRLRVLFNESAKVRSEAMKRRTEQR